MLPARGAPTLALHRHHQGVRAADRLDLSSGIQAATAVAVLRPAVRDGERADSDSLAPDGATIVWFCRWWFENTRRGVLEIGWIDARTGGLTRFEQFALNEIDALAVTAAQANMVPGQSCYIRAATV